MRKYEIARNTFTQTIKIARFTIGLHIWICIFIFYYVCLNDMRKEWERMDGSSIINQVHFLLSLSLSLVVQRRCILFVCDFKCLTFFMRFRSKICSYSWNSVHIYAVTWSDVCGLVRRAQRDLSFRVKWHTMAIM